MGTLFSKPSVPAYSPVQYVSPTSTQENVSDSEVSQSETLNEEEAVKDVVRRASRGRNTTIQTSYRGVLNQDNKLSPQRKTLLGE